MRLTVGLCCVLFNLGFLQAQPTCTFVGSASSLGDDCYEITSGTPWPGSPAPFEFGAVWFNQQLDLTDPFTIDVQVGLGDDDGGADGIVMVLQTAGPNTIGVGGEGLGFGGIAPSFGVEIDTHFNADNLPNYPFGDVSQDHVAFQRDGVIFHDLPYFNLAGPNPALPSGANIEDGELHGIKLEWDPTAQVIAFYFDCELRLTLNIDLVDEIFNGQSSVWWGFTGATGGLVNQQTACITASSIGLPPLHSVCEGEGVELALTSTTPGSVTWSPVTGLSDPNSAVTTATPSETTEYTATWTDVCGDVLTEETTVEVVPAPNPELPAEVEFCPGEIVTLEVEVPPGGTGSWSDGTPGGTWTGNDPGLQSVEVTSAEGCMGAAASTVVELLPMAVELPEIGPLCPDEVVEVSWPAGTVDWTVDGDPTASPWSATEGAFDLTWVDDATGCGMDLNYEVASLVADVPELPSDYEVCSGEGTVLELTAGAGAVISWSPVTGLDDPAAEQPTATPPTTTTYEAAVTDVCGGLTTLPATVTVFEVPDPGLPDSVALCPGAETILSVEPLPGVPQPTWSDGSTGWSWTGNNEGWQIVVVSPLPQCSGTDSTYVLAQDPASPAFDVDPLCPGEFTFIPWPEGWEDWVVGGVPADASGLTVAEPGVYFLVAVDGATGCNVPGSIVVPTGALTPMSLPEYAELCDDQVLNLSTGTPDPVTWNDGETGSTRTITSAGMYTATHTTECGSVTDSVEVVAVPCGCAVFAPSAFTPDGDFVNDAWRPSFECAPEEYSLKIFNRWGAVIWESSDPEEYWTGGYREDGRPLEQKLYYVRDGIYAFQVTYRDPTSVVRKMIRKTGSIMILR